MSADLSYEELPELDRKEVDRHIRLSAQLVRWRSIQSHLIDQIHQNKLTKRPNGGWYQPKDPVTKSYYDKYLFLGLKTMVDGHFMGPFRCYLEDVLARNLDSKFDFTVIYYKPDELSPAMEIARGDFHTFAEEDWALDKCPHMTERDIEILRRYRDGLIAFLDSCTDIVKSSEIDHKKDPYGARECSKMAKKIARITNF